MGSCASLMSISNISHSRNDNFSGGGKLKRLFFIIALLAMGSAPAAGMDCSKARKTMELAICGDTGLQLADRDLNYRYAFLRSYCRDLSERADLRATQRRWLDDTLKDFNRPNFDGPSALDRLRAAYRTRNDALMKLINECTPAHGPIHATVTEVHDEKRGYKLLFVRTDPPLGGWRANDALFGFYYGAYPPVDSSGLKTYFASHKPVDARFPPPDYKIVANQGNLLVAHYTICVPNNQPGCHTYDYYAEFDLRTGLVITPFKIFTKARFEALAQSVNKKLQALAHARLASLPKENVAKYGDQYQKCIAYWREQLYTSIQQNFIAKGDMTFRYTPCSNSAAGLNGTGMDGLSLTMTPKEMRPYLNDYGKSLLLGEGDVLEPGSDAAGN